MTAAASFPSRYLSSEPSTLNIGTVTAVTVAGDLNTIARIFPYLLDKFGSNSGIPADFALFCKVGDSFIAYIKAAQSLAELVMGQTAENRPEKWNNQPRLYLTTNVISILGGFTKAFQGVCRISPKLTEKVNRRALSTFKNFCDFVSALSDRGEAVRAAFKVTKMYYNGESRYTETDVKKEESIALSEVAYRVGSAIFSISAIVLSGSGLVVDVLGSKAPSILGRVSKYGFPLLMLGAFVRTVVSPLLNLKELKEAKI
ncbi:MAG: hypothetical protein P0S95_04170 [Rhabdochlamydiaceae bacterium]|nr:hypothetical protein [Candidatus Amphrikana amoebophyrae]